MNLDTKYFKLVDRALNNKIRIEILKIIHENGSSDVQEIAKLTGRFESQISNYVSILKKAKIVVVIKEGRTSTYAIDYDFLTRINMVHDKLKKFFNA